LFRLKGYGMPAVGKTDETGDLYARVDVQLPTRLSDQEREHFDALKKLSESETHSVA
jgi:DnaJ-class molecular chaperone